MRTSNSRRRHTTARLPSAGGISDGGWNPATDTSKLLTAYKGGSHILSDILITSRIPYCAISHSSLHKYHVFFRKALPASPCHCQFLSIRHMGYSSRNCFYVLQVHDKRSMYRCKHPLVKAFPYFFCCHVGLIYGICCMD